MTIQVCLLVILGLTLANLAATSDVTAKKFSKLQSDMTNLKSNNQIGSRYCQLLAPNMCGPCTCFEDYSLQQKKFYCDCQNLAPKRDCLAFYQAGIKINGIYTVTMNNLKTMEVYCDQTIDGGGWTVIQRRVDNTVNFYRNWTEYKEGFGFYHKNFYLGNKNIYVATLQSIFPKGSELRIELEDWEGSSRYAKYKTFQVGNELTKYRMHVTGYKGNAGDSLSYSNDQQFSTLDQDNDDNSGGSCANIYRGGWWYKSCFNSHLNGEYLTYKQPQPGASRGIIWQHWKGGYSLKHVEMKVRRNV